MATGTPSKKGRGADNELWLSYEGKKPATEILANRALPLRSAWSLNSEPSNSLIWGENLGSLLSLASNPKVRGKVRLVYIDPPFSTQSVFHTRDNNHAYEDTIAQNPDWDFELDQELARIFVANCIIPNVQATFYTVDVAKLPTGEFQLIEINEGGMSGLSNLDPKTYYKNLFEASQDYSKRTKS